ncbi:MAG: bifunctional metallophosphatase/5'-nucleotidase, partial [Bacteroidales bacterium]|nr:bifunctional metallophosphatase/5'-nucleotidase [Bacteroidales bacterium]
MKTGHLTLLLAAFFASACGPREGEHTLTILTTDDVHGAWFDSTYVGEGTKPSLFAVKYVIDSVRNADGPENVLLLDAGDCLQGDNATYYYNFVDTLSPHPFPRLMAYMGYDAVVVGNHDIEAGHKVYDRVARDLGAEGIPFLAGNVVREDDGSLYFPLYKV